VDAEDLCDDAPDVGQVGEVGLLQEPCLAYDIVDLGSKLFHGGGVVERHAPLDGAGQGVGSCLQDGLFAAKD
jgi:hypothetical protein